MQNERLRPYFLLIALISTLALTWAVFFPFLKPLALAAVFAVVLQGLYGRVNRFLGGLPSLSAFLTVLIGVILILLPLSLVGALVGQEASGLYLSLEEGGGQSVAGKLLGQADRVFGPIIPGFTETARDVSANLDTYIRDGLQWIAGHTGGIFSSISKFLLSFFVFFIALYYLLRDGSRVRRTLIELSPLSDIEDREVFDRLELAINSTIRGNLTIAFVQGVVATLGFLVFGVPNAVLWGTLAAVAALIPGFGTALVIVPAVAFLFFTGATGPAFGLLLWGVLAVGLIDNLLGPKLIGSRMHLHPLLVLLAVLGGLIYFGPAGIFLGPLTVSLLFALLAIYSDFSKKSTVFSKQ